MVLAGQRNAVCEKVNSWLQHPENQLGPKQVLGQHSENHTTYFVLKIQNSLVLRNLIIIAYEPVAPNTLRSPISPKSTGQLRQSVSGPQTWVHCILYSFNYRKRKDSRIWMVFVLFSRFQ